MYDSTEDTLKHIETVRGFISLAITEMCQRALHHDDSKLKTPEKEVFDEMTPKLAGSTYGSDEYKGYLAQMKQALDHHYAVNSHHPEHYHWQCPICELQINDQAWEVAPQGPNESGVRYCPRCCKNGMIYEAELLLSPEWGIRGMSLLDILEMLCDWKAATLRHNDGDILRSIEINQKRFGYSDELKQILLNTVAELKLDKIPYPALTRSMA